MNWEQKIQGDFSNGFGRKRVALKKESTGAILGAKIWHDGLSKK